MNKEKMGFFLASLRNEKNLTQQDEADIFSITPQAISKWESGQSVPDVETLEKLSSFYSVSINEILNGERASINETEVTETSGFNKMLMSRLTPFILSCSLFLATCSWREDLEQRDFDALSRYTLTMLRLTARAAASERDATPSFAKIVLRCALMQSRPTCMSSAISRLFSPFAT